LAKEASLKGRLQQLYNSAIFRLLRSSFAAPAHQKPALPLRICGVATLAAIGYQPTKADINRRE
jgi:hypothetical protein